MPGAETIRRRTAEQRAPCGDMSLVAVPSSDVGRRRSHRHRRGQLVRDRLMADGFIKANLGCGERYHAEWTNIDITTPGPGVIQHDLSRGIPLPDASCEVVYHAA